MRPQTILPCLLGAALGAAGWMQALHWKSAAAPATDEDAAGRIVALENELDLLRRENESLRSLAQGGGEVKVEPELVAFVEQSLGLSFRSSPQIHRIAGEELQDRIAATIESRYGPHGLDSREQAWQLMGLLAADDRFAPQMAATQSIGARSWFDNQGGEGWVTHRFDPQSVPDQAALVRTLARILIHQNHPPAAGSEWPGDEAATCREAIQHGAAIAIENRFLARQALASGFTGVKDESGARELLDALSSFVRGLATFPSSLGLARAGRLMDQEEILSGLYSPPAITANFFDGFDDLKANPPTLPAASDEFLLEESAGMLGLNLWLQPLGEEAIPLADAWRGDRYRLFATSDNDVHLVWDIRFDSAASADAFVKTALTAVAAMAGAETDPAVGTILTTPEDRFVGIQRSAPEVVRFINAATQEGAASLAP
ncbi:hypothetical protein [Luteolibacter sp. Populi]|uniref:hypothetical protein n=1 Tax=Luteolibacter sp. Populi TaxID=3230487 RepID=UPI00346660AE